MIIFLLLGTVVSSSAFLDSLWAEYSNCTSNEFTCRNGRCITSNFRCDGVNNCPDGSDEQDCEMYLCKEPKYFRCNNKRCISKSFVCDEENDCEDFSDEVNCDSFKISNQANSTCEKGHWRCTDHLCIPDEWVCNGELDCLDGSDEGIGCSSKIACDGFKCKNGHCVPKEWRCDGNDDCHDKSDEEDCENHVPLDKCTMDERKFLCANNRTCIDIYEACNGHPHCPDKSDEGTLCSIPSLACDKHGCSHECAQLPTGPKCMCPKGYHTIDDKNCKDINECEQYGICDQKCRNTAGSYECYCDHKYFLKEDKKTCKALGGEAMLVFSSKTEIRAVTLNSEVYFPVAKHLKQVVGVEYDGRHVYWTDIFAEHESIVRSIEDGSERELLVTSGLGLPEDLSVDWLTGNIYFTDAEKRHIGVCTSNGDHCTVLVNKDVRKPRGIVLNVEEGDMYWTDWGEPAEISYSLMDGTHDKPFVSNDIHWPNGLALDQSNGRLYWTDARKMSLESIRLDGTDRKTVLQDVVKHPYAIAVFEDKLYWSDWYTHSIQSCDKFTGKNHHTIVKEEREFIYGISIFHSALHKRVVNPCSLSFCSDICLLKGNGYSCACPQDKVLSSDGHVCRDVGSKQMLVVGAKNVLVNVEYQRLGKHDVTSMATVVKNIGCLAYDSFDNSLLISDMDTEKIVSLDLDTGISKVLDITGLGQITAMDYDVKGNNLYVCNEDKATLEVINLNTMAKKVLIHDMQGEVPESIAVIPEEGVMFVAFKKKDTRTSHIDRFYMDGTGRTHALDKGLLGPLSLHYDRELDRVFFTDAGAGTIESTSIEGDDRHGFRILTSNPIGVTALNEDLFWVNEDSKRLYWAEKKSDSSYNKKITLDLPEELKRLHILSITPKQKVISACRTNNNGCSHLCLMSHKITVCACPSGWELQNDNRTCTKRAHCTSNEILCAQSNDCVLKSLRCNNHKDCAFGEDELDCDMKKKCASEYFQCDDGECIREEHVCNHHYDCKDKSDEHNCAEKRKMLSCPPQHFRCSDGECIAERFLCDGVKDCKDASDEGDCHSTSCSETEFRCDSGTCIPKSWECDHEYDCTDFSDEHGACASATCPSTLYTCGNGKCIDRRLLCDEDDDCGDNSDETQCYIKSHDNCSLDEFACAANKSICLPVAARCNGSSECPQGDDEKDCSICMSHDYTCVNKMCIPYQWMCDGLDDCGDGSDEGIELCKHKNDTEIVGPFAHVSCEDGFRCKAGECIEFDFVCDGKHNCYDGSDEDGLCSTSCDKTKNPCSQECVKTPVGPMCRCKPGFKLMGDGFSCNDENECENLPPVCSQLCHNNDGGYTCDCYEQFLLRTDKKSCKAEGAPMSLVFTTDDQIRELTQKSNRLSILFSAKMPKISGLDALANPKSVYFSIETASTIHRIDIETQTRHYMEHVGQPQKLAVDWSTRNVYYYNAESNSKSVSVCSFEEMLCAKLFDVDTHRQVSALAVDPVNKVLFYALSSWWVFSSPSYMVYKINLDGSENQELVKTTPGFVTGLTFDHNKKHVYYVDQHSGRISTMNYEGKMKMPLFNNVTRSVGLKFFENHLYYLTTGGYITKCSLFDVRKCHNVRLHSHSSDLFAIVQDSLQPRLDNVCRNHTCPYLCVPSKTYSKCLCKDGSVVSNMDTCPSSDRDSQDDGRQFTVHSVSATEDVMPKKTGSTVATVILTAAVLALVAALAFYIIRKRSNGRLSVSMRFYNPSYQNQVDDDLDKPILKPGQHEYSNPVHFCEDSSNASPKA